MACMSVQKHLNSLRRFNSARRVTLALDLSRNDSGINFNQLPLMAKVRNPQKRCRRHAILKPVSYAFPGLA